MISTTHPDATAFAARFLANPQDRLGRLVFADWLEERGGESNLAWADYIRTQAEMETLRWNDPAWDELTELSAESTQRVRAKLNITVKRFDTLTTLSKLIPPQRCVVQADHLPFDFAARELLPESVAWEHQLIPLHAAPWEIFCGCPSPADQELQAKLTFILNRHVTLFAVGSEVVNDSIYCRYALSEPIPPGDEANWIAPEISPLVAEAVLNSVLEEMVFAGVVDVSFQENAGYVLVAYFTIAGWRQRKPMTMEEFGAVFSGVRAKMGVAELPGFPNRIEFWHTIGEQRYHARGHWSSEGSHPRLWFGFSSVNASVAQTSAQNW